MTEGERIFYLREIHGGWHVSNVSAEKLAELAEAKLIELQPGAHPLARLTKAGQQCKLEGRSHYNTTLPTSRLKPTRPRRRGLKRA